MKITVTENLICDLKTNHGGAFTRRGLALLGVAWPPVKGWKYRIMGTVIEVDENQLRQEIQSAKALRLARSNPKNPELPRPHRKANKRERREKRRAAGVFTDYNERNKRLRLLGFATYKEYLAK